MIKTGGSESVAKIDGSGFDRENGWKLIAQKWVGVQKRMEVVSSKTGGSWSVVKRDGSGSVCKNGRE